jgi:hypothetical protein
MHKVDIRDVSKQANGVTKYAIDRCAVVSVFVPEPTSDKEGSTSSVSAKIHPPITTDATSASTRGDGINFRKFNVLIATQDIAKGHVITLCKPWYVASASSMLSVGEGNGINAVGGDKFEGYFIPSKTMPSSMYVGSPIEEKPIPDRRQFSYDAMRISAKDCSTENGAADFITETVGTLCNGWMHFCPERPAFPSAPIKECLLKESSAYYGNLANAGTVCYPIQTLLDGMLKLVYDVTKGGVIGEWTDDQIDRFIFRYICVTSSAVNAHKDVRTLALPSIVATKDIKAGEVICIHEAPTTALWNFLIGNLVPTSSVVVLVSKFLRRVSVDGYWDDVRQRMMAEESSAASSSSSS